MCVVVFTLSKDAAQQCRERQVFFCTRLRSAKAQNIVRQVRQFVGVCPLLFEICGQIGRISTHRRKIEWHIGGWCLCQTTGVNIDLLDVEICRQSHRRAVLQAVQERFNASDDTHIGKMLIHFDLQVGFIAHLLLEQVREHGVRAAAVVGQVDSVEVRVVSNQLCSGQDMLTERIIKIIVFIGDVQRMTGQVAQRDDFIAAFQQQFRDAHVQDGVGNAVVAGDEHQHFIVRSQGRQQSFALFFHGGGMAAHRHGTTEQSFGTKRFRDS